MSRTHGERMAAHTDPIDKLREAFGRNGAIYRLSQPGAAELFNLMKKKEWFFILDKRKASEQEKALKQAERAGAIQLSPICGNKSEVRPTRAGINAYKSAFGSTAKKPRAKKTKTKKTQATTPKKEIEIIYASRVNAARDLAEKQARTVAPSKMKKILAGERKRLIAAKKEQTKSVRVDCRESKKKASARRADQRMRLMIAWRTSKESEQKRIETSCKERMDLIERTYQAGRAKVAAIAAARKAQREAMSAHKRGHASQAQLRGRARAAEKRAETVDQVRSELQAVAPRLVPYFETVKGRLKKDPKVSLVEQVLALAESHPDDVVLASSRKADRDVHAIVKEGIPKWKEQAQKIEYILCERATKAAKSGKLFRFKDRELGALEKLGISAERIASECYNAAIPRRRKVSQRLEAAPF